MLILLLILFILGALYAFSKIDCSILLAFYDKYYSNQKSRLANSTVWIVGSSSGIGEQLAYEFAKLNCKIILTSTTRSKLDKVKRNCLSISSLNDDDILILPCDISDLKTVKQSFKIVLETFGDIDILVNNAARINSCEDAVSSGIDNELEIDKKIFNINYFGNIYLSKLVVSHWEKSNSKGLKIVAVTSSAASLFSAAPYFSTYVSSKMALNNFYRDLRLQYPKIQISNCMPGPTDSKMAENALGNRKIRMKEGRKKMETQRCAHLMVVAIANRLFEFIICEQSWLSLCFASIYLNYEIYSIMCFTNAAKRFKDAFVEDDETKL